MPYCRGCLAQVPNNQVYMFTWHGVRDLFVQCTAVSVGTTNNS